MIFLDSSLIVAYSNKADVNHNKALQVIEDIDKGMYGSSFITDYIFDEVVTVMLVKTKNLGKVSEFGDKLLGSNLLLIVAGDIFNMAWDIYKEQETPIFTYTDCTSIAICRANGISNIATFDINFQALKEFKIIAL